MLTDRRLLLRRRRFAFSVCNIVVCVLVSGCFILTNPSAQHSTTTLEFLEGGKTTKETVILKLGPWFISFDQEQIISYRLAKTKGGYFALERVPPRTHPSWRLGKGENESLVVVEQVPIEHTSRERPTDFGIEGTFDLILQFDGHGVLQQHSLLPID